MNNDAFVAALGRDAATVVRGYRQHVISEAQQRGLRLVIEALLDVGHVAADADGDGLDSGDPIDIRLTFLHCPGWADLAGRTLRWCPAHGWSLSHRTANAPLSYYAGPMATPLLLVPTALEVVDWATGEFDGPATPPVGVELDDDAEAIHRLLGYLDDGRQRARVGGGTGPSVR
jgi:hypothetical protein